MSDLHIDVVNAVRTLIEGATLSQTLHEVQVDHANLIDIEKLEPNKIYVNVSFGERTSVIQDRDGNRKQFDTQITLYRKLGLGGSDPTGYTADEVNQMITLLGEIEDLVTEPGLIITSNITYESLQINRVVDRDYLTQNNFYLGDMFVTYSQP